MSAKSNKPIDNLKSILFVCTGNICRSPTAHWVMQYHASAKMPQLKIDSCGTHAYHVGEGADKRSAAIANKRGICMQNHKARKFDFSDYYEFGVILAMDESHLDYLLNNKPHNSKAEIALFLEYAGMNGKNVSDPYYGGLNGFEKVFDQIENSCIKILEKYMVKNSLAG